MGLGSAQGRLSSAGLSSACHQMQRPASMPRLWGLCGWRMKVLPLHGMSLGPQRQSAPMHDQGTVLLGTSRRCHRRSGPHGPLPPSAVTSHSTPPTPLPHAKLACKPIARKFSPQMAQPPTVLRYLSSTSVGSGTALLGDYFINIKSKVPSVPSM